MSAAYRENVGSTRNVRAIFGWLMNHCLQGDEESDGYEQRVVLRTISEVNEYILDHRSVLWCSRMIEKFI